MRKTAGSPKARSRDHTRRRLAVVVVDPLAVVRVGLAMLIADQPDMHVLAEAGSAGECLGALSRTRRSRPVVLVALGLSGERDSVWLIGTLRERYPKGTRLPLETVISNLWLLPYNMRMTGVWCIEM
jgi:hypothetical protein